MNYPQDILTRAGTLLYRELPEEYRYQDAASPGELGDLEAYLHGFGHLLDLIRHTTEQAYADAFAEETEDGHTIQPWLIPYLAELVGAELQSPDPDARMAELNSSVLWSKSKGTLRTVDDVSDVVSGAETVVREGWRLTLTTPRPGLPPFSVPDTGSVLAPGCPDLRRMDRAVVDPGGSNPLYRLRRSSRDADGLLTDKGVELYWKPRAPGGAPCFPGAYDDGAARCPDLRDPMFTPRCGPHPRRSLIHLVPPDGLFGPGLKVVSFADPLDLNISAGDEIRLINPREILELSGDTGPVPDRLIVELDDDLEIPDGARVIFEDILLTGRNAGAARPVRLRVLEGGQLTMSRSAAQDVTLANPPPDAPDLTALRATDCMLGAITGPAATAELVFCTVGGVLDLAQVRASDCLLGEISSNLQCGQAGTCVRYSRMTPPAESLTCFLQASPGNTSIEPRFVHRWLKNADNTGCRFRLPVYGEPGYGVLDTTAAPEITAGAEDEGEMGACHSLFYAAALRALSKKLKNYLPLGQEIALTYDPHLSLTPPVLVTSED